MKLYFVHTTGETSRRRRSGTGQADKTGTAHPGNSPHSPHTRAFECVNVCNCINLNFISQVVLIDLLMTMQILQMPVWEKKLKKVKVNFTPSICNSIPSVCAFAFENVINFDYVVSFCRCC